MQISIDDPNALEIIAAARQLNDAMNRVRSLPANQAEELLRFVSVRATSVADNVVIEAAAKEAKEAAELNEVEVVEVEKP